jgi:thiamine pyrophosphate-dependent acetolactate synthase large subunit-like protein
MQDPAPGPVLVDIPKDVQSTKTLFHIPIASACVVQTRS